MNKKGRRYLIEPQTRLSGSPDSHSGKAEVRTAAFTCKVQQQIKRTVKRTINVDSKKQKTKEISIYEGQTENETISGSKVVFHPSAVCKNR